MEYFMRKKTPPFPWKLGSSSSKHVLCMLLSFGFSHFLNCAPLLVTASSPHCAAEETNKSQQRCESLWLQLRLCRSKMKTRYSQSQIFRQRHTKTKKKKLLPTFICSFPPYYLLYLGLCLRDICPPSPQQRGTWKLQITSDFSVSFLLSVQRCRILHATAFPSLLWKVCCITVEQRL